MERLRNLARRPALGTPVDWHALSLEALAAAVRDGTGSVDDAILELLRRGATGATAEAVRIQTLVTVLSTLGERARAAGGRTSPLIGGFIFAYCHAARVVRREGANQGVIAEADERGGEARGSSGRAAAAILRPKNISEFSAFLNAWVMICHTTGILNILVAGTFLNDVVFDILVRESHSWQVAHEVFLLYLELVELSPPEAGFTVSNVFLRAGAQDTMLRKATQRAAEYFRRAPGIGGDGGGSGGGGGSSGGAELQWNGKFNKSSQNTCHTFNLSGAKHPKSSLRDGGGCIFNHICDAYVSDKGPKGTCGGDHPRFQCQNPKRVQKPVAA